MAFVEHGSFQVKDLRQFFDKLFRKGSTPVDQQHRTAEGIEALKIPLALDSL